MKKIIISMVVIIFSLFVFAEEAPVFKGESSFWIASMKFTGSFKEMAAKMRIFLDEYFKQGLESPAPIVGIFHNVPRIIKDEKDLMWELGVPVEKGTKVKPPLKTHNVKFPETLAYVHVGPYEKLDEVHKELLSQADKKGYNISSPIIHRFLEYPPKVTNSSEFKTEILIPIRKK